MRKNLLITTALLTVLSSAIIPSAHSLPAPRFAMQTAVSQPEFQIDKNHREDKPVKLTASDGTGLQLTSYHAKVVVDGPLAFTELHMTFRNPQERILEGHFEITLPQQAALSRLAIKNANGWQEAEVVELQKARQAYEDFLHRRQDPALLEKQAGNQFQARIFPIPAQGEKEIVLSYSQELTSDQAYSLPLGGLPQVPELSVDAAVWSGPQKGMQNIQYKLKDEAPRGDLEIRRPASIPGLINGDLAVVSIAPRTAESESKLKDTVVLVDTSASRAAGYQAEISKLEGVLQAFAQAHPKARVTIAAFDQRVVPLFHGSIQDRAPAIAALKARRPLGATNLAQALRWAGRQKGFQRLLLVTDGVTTSGVSRIPKVEGLARVDAMLVGGIRDGQFLQDLVEHKQSESGLLLDGDKSANEICRSLLHCPVSGVNVAVEGAEWVWPERLEGVEPGQERLVYAKLKAPQQQLHVSLSGSLKQQFNVPLVSRESPLLKRAVVSAQLAHMNVQRLRLKGKDQEGIAAKMVALSVANRVVCDLTGLLVLETDDDYARFKIDRTALTDIMVAGDKGVELYHRQTAVVNIEKTPQAPTDDAFKKSKQELALTAPKPQPATAAKADASFAESGVGQSYQRSATADVTAVREVNSPAPSVGGAQPIMNAAPPEAPAEPQRQEERLAPQSERSRRMPQNRRRPQPHPPAPEANEEDGKAPALTGKLLDIDQSIKAGHAKEALSEALEWQGRAPGDVLALVGLGESYEAVGNKTEAARAYGSIIDLFPARADLRRFAGSRLEALGMSGEDLAADSFEKALEQRPDHPSSYRMRAYALVRLGRLEEAFSTLEKGVKQEFPSGRFLGCDRILREDLALVGAAWAAKQPGLRPAILKRLQAVGGKWEDAPSTRFVLSWETDANDVDFHIRDSKGGHAFYSSKDLPSGGSLYADVTTGYGPECFNIPGKPTAGPYKIFIHYYSRGPMGYGMGKVEIVRHDGKGGLTFEERPYVVMNDHAYVDLGKVEGR